MGFCGTDDDVLKELVALVQKYKHTYVKVSALFRLSKRAYPYKVSQRLKCSQSRAVGTSPALAYEPCFLTARRGFRVCDNAALDH